MVGYRRQTRFVAEGKAGIERVMSAQHLEGFHREKIALSGRLNIRHHPFWLTVITILACLIGFVGCTDKERVHPALRIEGERLDQAIRRGKSMISKGSNPDDALIGRLTDVNLRVSPDVILRQASCTMPDAEVAYEICKAADPSDGGVRRAVNTALKCIERELKCCAFVQVDAARDPNSIEFFLRTNLAQEYPPILVDSPVFVRDVMPAYDPNAKPAKMYRYVAHFPVQGGPGVPPIGPNVSTLSLVVRDGDGEAKVSFPLKEPRTSYRP